MKIPHARSRGENVIKTLCCLWGVRLVVSSFARSPLSLCYLRRQFFSHKKKSFRDRETWRPMGAGSCLDSRRLGCKIFATTLEGNATVGGQCNRWGTHIYTPTVLTFLRRVAYATPTSINTNLILLLILIAQNQTSQKNKRSADRRRYDRNSAYS